MTFFNNQNDMSANDFSRYTMINDRVRFFARHLVSKFPYGYASDWILMAADIDFIDGVVHIIGIYNHDTEKSDSFVEEFKVSIDIFNLTPFSNPMEEFINQYKKKIEEEKQIERLKKESDDLNRDYKLYLELKKKFEGVTTNNV